MASVIHVVGEGRLEIMGQPEPFQGSGHRTLSLVGDFGRELLHGIPTDCAAVLVAVTLKHATTYRKRWFRLGKVVKRRTVEIETYLGTGIVFGRTNDRSGIPDEIGLYPMDKQQSKIVGGLDFDGVNRVKGQLVRLELHRPVTIRQDQYRIPAQRKPGHRF